MSFSETIFLFVLALVIFGPKKLPEIARYVGKTLAEFRRASNEFKAQIEQEIAHLEVEDKRQTILPPSPTPSGTASRTLDSPSSEVASSTTSGEATSSASTAPSIPVDPSQAASGSADGPVASAAAPEPPATPLNRAEPAATAIPAAESATTNSQESHA